MTHNLYTHADSNVRKTWLYLAAVFGLLIGLGFIFSRMTDNPVFLFVFVGISIVGNIISYWHADRIALAMSGARPIPREENVRLWRAVENLTITAGLPMPRLYMIEGQQINAFATGRDAQHAAIAVTRGALERLDDNELTGVLAHELSHIGNRDILLSTVVIVIVGMVSILADLFLRVSIWGRSDDDDRNSGPLMLVVAIVASLLAPLAATLIQLAISRKREYLADASGVLLTRYPEGLAHALEKIAMDQAPLPTAHSATAHLFLSSPFKGKAAHSWFTRLFMTHPPITERIKVLRGSHETVQE
jgi:heat shock protein HtpX